MEPITVNTKEIGKRIRQKRKSMYMTSADINNQIAIAPATLSDIERGNKSPSCLTLLKLSEILECSTDWILKGTDESEETSRNIVLSDRENQLIGNYRLLSENDKTEIDEFIQIKLRIK